MNTLFVIIVAAMIAAALAFVLPPLLRHGRGKSAVRGNAKLHALDQALAAGVISDDEHASKRARILSEPSDSATAAPPRTRTAFNTAIATALLLPLAAIAAYYGVGEPRALDPAALAAPANTESADGHGMDMQQSIDGLVAKLKQSPDDVEGWMLLGRAYKSTERFTEARDALKHAYDIAADNPDVQVDYAESIALASPSRRIEGESLELLQKALVADPMQQRALWLLGIADYQAERYADAITHWEALRAQIPAESPALTSIQNQIDDARSRAGMPADAHSAATGAAAQTASATATAGEAATATSPVKLTVQVSLDPKLAGRTKPDAIVFIFAKAASGPPMPLAVQRLTVSQLPATVSLDDSMGMMPSLKLSQFPQVIVGARISASGNAIAQSGDLQTVSAPMDVHNTSTVELRIDTIVP